MNFAAQHSVHPTGGSLRVFRHFSWLEVGSGKMALPRPGRAPGWCPIPPTSGYRLVAVSRGWEIEDEDFFWGNASPYPSAFFYSL